ncbi:replication protein [Sinorhizobium meliloti]|uniref:poly-gamma-glutamate hydrolase family protein n=1 Tax=Rhizobium meliloti TaxID=382 RepID=UPI000FD749E8|nr:poly-gamma-glutamate hydrolase family protein [Sinorhizobium meliloti]RVG00663.1 replication protein [Sinorhizobium meliloti]RVH46796.1 replication protein [Sinorhizobium meliloti]RVK16902.1 replication protein [Sinorhizobium meliloti]
MAYRFSNYKDLAAVYCLGTDYLVRHRAGNGEGVLVMTPHGGKIEKPASVIAAEIAGQDHSFYAFEGNLNKGNLFELHIPSETFDEPRALDLAARATFVIAVHGRKDYGDTETIWMGGRDTASRQAIGEALIQAGFKIDDDPPKFRGREMSNICNRGKSGMGVQLEIPSTLRGTFTAQPEERLRLVNAVRAALVALTAARV